jgi:DNA gyrase/topoisomerase IV subunit B
MSKRTDKPVEEIYKKMSQLEHVLARPDTYVGSVIMQNEKMWVWDEGSESMVSRQISFVPGLYKIFDEILVNAADNKIRDPKGTTLTPYMYRFPSPSRHGSVASGYRPGIGFNKDIE